MLRIWRNWVESVSQIELRKALQGTVAVLGVGLAALFMWRHSQVPSPAVNPDSLLSQEAVLPGEEEEEAAPQRPARTPPQIITNKLDQLVIHVDKHGNIDVAGEVINTELFRNLLQTVKQDSDGAVSVLIHANEKCEVATLQKVVDVCEESLTQYRLRIEDNRGKQDSSAFDPTRA
jgi:biopolymer transport protein ExbD